MTKEDLRDYYCEVRYWLVLTPLDKLGIDYWDVKYRIYDAWTDLLIWTVEKTCRYKDRCLAHRLHRLADQYDPRPTGEWD